MPGLRSLSGASGLAYGSNPACGSAYLILRCLALFLKRRKDGGLYFFGAAAADWVESAVQPAPRALIKETLAARRCALNWTTVWS